MHRLAHEQGIKEKDGAPTHQVSPVKSPSREIVGRCDIVGSDVNRYFVHPPDTYTIVLMALAHGFVQHRAASGCIVSHHARYVLG